MHRDSRKDGNSWAKHDKQMQRSLRQRYTAGVVLNTSNGTNTVNPSDYHLVIAGTSPVSKLHLRKYLL